MPPKKQRRGKTLTPQERARLKKAFLAVLEAKRSFDAKIKQLDNTVTATSIRGG